VSYRGGVLFVASNYAHLAAFHKPFMELLKGKRCQVDAAALDLSGRKAEIDALGVNCWDIPFARSPYSARNIEACQGLRHLLKGNYFDLIHVHTPVPAFLTRFMARKLNQGPVLYTAHGFHFYLGAALTNQLLYYNAERLAAQWTDGLIVMNKEDFEAGKKLGFEPNKTLFHINGVGIDLSITESIGQTGRIKAELNISEDAVVIACVAELNSNKNHDFLLKAWRQLVSKYNDVHLLLVGEGQLDKNLRKMVNEYQIPRVHFLGFRKDVPQILSESDVVTLVSKRESNTTANMGTISFWKVLATIAGANTGKVYGKFNNIKIAGSAPSLSEPEVDNANVTVSSNDVTVVVDSLVLDTTAIIFGFILLGALYKEGGI